MQIRIIGDAPLVINKFSKKAKEQMRAKHEARSVANKGEKREPKDFNAVCEGAKYKSKDGWCGINASAFRLCDDFGVSHNRLQNDFGEVVRHSYCRWLRC